MKKWVTLGKMGHAWKNGSHREKWVTLKRRVTFRKVDHTCKTGSQAKMGYTQKSGSHRENRSYLRKKGFTLAKLGHIGKMGHI